MSYGDENNLTNPEILHLELLDRFGLEFGSMHFELSKILPKKHLVSRFLKETTAGNLLSENGPWLAGGTLRRLLAGETFDTNDFDIFFRDVDQRNAYEKQLAEAGYQEVYRCPQNLLTTYYDKHDNKVQSIGVNFYSDAELVIDSFDFTVSQVVTDGLVVWIGEHTLHDTANRYINLHTLTHPNATMRRVEKYVQHGYHMTPAFIDDFTSMISLSAPANFNWEHYVD